MDRRAAVRLALTKLNVNLRSERFSLSQALRGAIVELEHTDDLLVATKIAVDHLRELPDYYERLDKMERAAPLPKTWPFNLTNW